MGHCGWGESWVLLVRGKTVHVSMVKFPPKRKHILAKSTCSFNAEREDHRCWTLNMGLWSLSGDVAGPRRRRPHTLLSHGAFPERRAVLSSHPDAPASTQDGAAAKVPKLGGRSSAGSPPAPHAGSATSCPVWSWLSLLQDAGAKANRQSSMP